MFFVDAPVRTFYFDLDMTNEELIVKIKVEIDKRYADYREKMKTDDFTYYEGMADALDLFEQFIDTLESEKPVPNDIEEAAVDIADALLAKPKDYVLSAKADYWNGAHDGIITGAKWGAKQILEYVKLAYGKVSMNPFDCSEAFEELINKINALWRMMRL